MYLRGKVRTFNLVPSKVPPLSSCGTSDSLNFPLLSSFCKSLLGPTQHRAPTFLHHTTPTMPPTGFSVPAARISVMVNMAYLLGKGAISPQQYNVVSSYIEGTDTTTTSSKRGIYQRRQQPEFCYSHDSHITRSCRASGTSPGGGSASPDVATAGPHSA